METLRTIQCKNIPSNITELWVSCGSAITICGILYGLSLYPNNVKCINAVGIAPNRYNKILDYCHLIECNANIKIHYELLNYIDAYNTLPGYKYENVKKKEYCGLKFHPRYEAKTFEYLSKYGKMNDNILFWIIGADIT